VTLDFVADGILAAVRTKDVQTQKPSIRTAHSV
jgi:hypothetical protein